MRNLTIGTVAKESGVNVETIRYYQRRGLLREPAKPAGGFRQYSKTTVKRVRFIKRAQTLGFSLEEVLALLILNETKSCVQTREIAAHKLELIEQKIADLTKIKKALFELVHSCEARSSGATCPIIELLVQDSINI